MQETGNKELLSAHVREEIDRWVAKFPPGRQRSAVIGALSDGERVVVRGGHAAPLAPPDRDELWRVLEVAGRA